MTTTLPVTTEKTPTTALSPSRQPTHHDGEWRHKPESVAFDVDPSAIWMKNVLDLRKRLSRR